MNIETCKKNSEAVCNCRSCCDERFCENIRKSPFICALKDITKDDGTLDISNDETVRELLTLAKRDIENITEMYIVQKLGRI